MACTPEVKDTASESSNLAPAISWTAPTDRVINGQPLTITVDITDDDGIQSAIVYYRGVGSSYWEQLDLQSEGNTDEWSATIDMVTLPGVEFYIKAEDLGSPIATALYPSGGPSAPMVVDVFPESRPLPFEESFELEAGEITLLDMDWWSPSETRDTFQWLLNESAGHTGTSSVYHLRGADGMPELRDWLISPPLDFSTETEIMVGWWEFGLAVDLLEEHSLWVSTGSRLPEDGDFELVEVLDVPISGEWSRHRYIDLSEYAGEELVYIGWRWNGSNSDEWSIDDVDVRKLAPDLALEITSPSTEPSSDTTVAVIVENLTNGVADDCSTTLNFSEGVTPAEVIEDGWSIAGQEVILQEFEVTIAAAVNPHQRVPVDAVVVCGEDTWTISDFIQIGQPSLAQATVDVIERSQVTATVGYGDPLSPTWSQTMNQSILDVGIHQLSLDVTDQFAVLPPEAGAERWFLQVSSTGTTVVESFTVGYGTIVVGTSTTAVAFPDFPVEMQVPTPPVFEVLSTSPTNAQPGDTNVPVFVELANFGADTQGMVVGSVFSDDPDVTIVTSQLGVVDADVWTRNEIHTVSTTIHIDDSHTSSTPVEISVLLADAVESWIIPVLVEVPFPRLGITGVVVLDSDGNDDGRLDPNESAQLEIQISNSGGQSANGVVQGELTLEATSTASATIVNDNPSFGFLNAGAQKDEDDFLVSVTSGVVGDTLDFLLTMEDNTNTYTDRVQLMLGETPWIGVSPLLDDSADSLDSTAVDLESVEYRVTGTVVEMRIASSTIVDPTTTFIEAWGRSGGSGYAYYRWVVQSGVGTLQGYISGVGFQPLGTLTISYPDAYHIIWSFDSVDLDLALDQFEIGFASGWCGPPEYYCDQYPDGWGYPYVSFNAGQWFEIEW